VFADLDSITVCLLSGEMIDAPLLRLTVEPTPQNGLETRSQIMVDKLVTVPRGKIGLKIGALEQEMLVRVDRSLALFLGIA
jgi:mRNA interferase MazF